MVTNLRKCLDLLPSHRRWPWGGLIPLALIAAGLEAAGAAAVFTVITIINNPDRLADLPLVAALFNASPWHDEQTFTLVFCGLVALFYTVKNGFLSLEVYARSLCANRSAVALSARLLRGYLAAPYTFHLQRNSAELIRNCDSAVDLVCRTVLASAVAAASETLIVAGIVAVLLVTAPLVTLATGAITVAILAVILKLTQQKFSRWGTEVHELNRAILATLQQTLEGVKEVKILGCEQYFHTTYVRLRAALARFLGLRTTLEAVPRLLVEVLFVWGVVAIIVGTELLSAGQHLMSLLGLFTYAGLRILPSAHRIVYHLNNIRFGSAAIDEVYNDFMGHGVQAQDSPRQPTTQKLPFNDCIRLDRVSYTYADRQEPALREITLHIARGESIGIIGPSGAGKSTLVDLILGLLQPSAGRVMVDGSEITEDLRAWQYQIGYVPQSVFLIDESLRRNIALGLQDDQIEAQKLRLAVRRAQLEAFVDTLPAGLETVLGERGVRLSGGQRQRVAIARALYHDPEVLVFDEATAALDHQTEAELVRAIESLGKQKTVLIIAHRSSTVRHCDRLVFLRAGRMVDCGPPAELLARYAELQRAATLTSGNAADL